VVDRLEPLVPERGSDGILGMDVLRDCILVLDAQRLVARCEGMRATPSGDVSLLPKLVQLDAGGPWLEQRANGGYRYRGEHLQADVAADGAIEVSYDRAPKESLRGPREEAAWLVESTRLQRYRMQLSRYLRLSLDNFPRHLERVWSDPQWTAAERRELLFLLWDECAEADDAWLGAAGAQARGIIERFVRAQLPRGSPDGYADAELERLNRRRPRGPRYRPYDVSPFVDRP
jgi:hypothetical protein